VCEWGMSDVMGPLAYAKKEGNMFLGEGATSQTYSEDTAVMIDQEIKRIVVENYVMAKGLLVKHHAILDNVARALLDRESLDGEEINQIIAGTSPELS